MRATEKYEQKLEKDEEIKNYVNEQNPDDSNGLKLYEGMLIQAEKNIRNHIRVSNKIIIIINLEWTRIKINNRGIRIAIKRNQ